MLYIPQINKNETKENHREFIKRLSLYKTKEMDFIEDRNVFLRKAYPLEGRILELGTGSGHTALALAREGHDFISIDTDESSLKTAALNLSFPNFLSKATFYKMSAEEMDFDDNFFKSIVSVCLMHHIADPQKILSETNRVLCPGGKIIFSDFNQKGLKIIEDVHLSEGKIHESSGVGLDEVKSYFCNLNYSVKIFHEKYYWILVAQK